MNKNFIKNDGCKNATCGFSDDRDRTVATTTRMDAGKKKKNTKLNEHFPATKVAQNTLIVCHTED